MKSDFKKNSDIKLMHFWFHQQFKKYQLLELQCKTGKYLTIRTRRYYTFKKILIYIETIPDYYIQMKEEKNYMKIIYDQLNLTNMRRNHNSNGCNKQ